MKDNKNLKHPPFLARIMSVWLRHLRVYSSSLFSNALPPFLEPLIFLFGIGFGLGDRIGMIGEVPYTQFLAIGLLVTSSMYTAAFECSFGTFIRLEFDKVYDGMLGSPITASDLLIGEILWAGTKGLFFSLAVLAMLLLLKVVPVQATLFLSPIVGFFTGIMFGVLSLFVTSLVKNINHFNFYFTGLLSPMFFFSGVVFRIEDLPFQSLRVAAEFLPLTHAVRLVRLTSQGTFGNEHLLSIAYILVFILIMGYLSIKRLTKRLID